MNNIIISVSYLVSGCGCFVDCFSLSIEHFFKNTTKMLLST